jgi:hypothetical protein
MRSPHLVIQAMPGLRPIFAADLVSAKCLQLSPNLSQEISCAQGLEVAADLVFCYVPGRLFGSLIQFAKFAEFLLNRQKILPCLSLSGGLA